MTEKALQYVAKAPPGAYRHARLGAPDAGLAQLRQAGLDHSSVARTFALRYERIAPQDPHRRLGLGSAGPQRLLCPRQARLLVKQEARRC